jgi:CubicO group peptidase (beta-lactamase class C family)
MVAQNGLMNGRQIVSKKWIDQCSSRSDKDQQVRYGKPSLVHGYKTFFWHYRKDGSWMMMSGRFGQHVVVDRNTQTVLVQTAIDELGNDWMREMLQLFGAATQLE